MGYRSEVTLGVDKKLYQKYKSKVSNPSLLREALEECEAIHESEGYFLFCWSWVKWYPDYGDVRVVEELIDLIEEEDEEGYGFIRVGEERDDIEVRGEIHLYDISTSTSINIYGDTKLVTDDFFQTNTKQYLENLEEESNGETNTGDNPKSD